MSLSAWERNLERLECNEGKRDPENLNGRALDPMRESERVKESSP